MSNEASKKLEAFLDIIASGEVPHAKIAELADVTVEDVAAFVARLEPEPVTPPEEAQPPEAAPLADPPAAEPPPAIYDIRTTFPSEEQAAAFAKREADLAAWLTREEVRLAQRAEQLADWDLELSRREMALGAALAEAGMAPKEALAAVASPPPVDRGAAPRAVRALRKSRILDAEGRLWHVRTRDVYTGEQAAFLWARHPDLVEAYNPILSG